MINTRNPIQLAAIIVATLAVLGGCNKDEDKKAATQVAAKVNGAEITVSQINSILSRANGITADNASVAKREILDKLIDQQLAVEQAMDKKLDRNPNVVQAVDAAKREVLARAYLEQVAATQPRPTRDEAKRFYAEHPELFSQRRLFNLQELAISATGATADEIRQWVNDGKSMQDIAGALKDRDIQFRANAGLSAAEQLPLELLPKFQALNDGQTAVIQSPKALLVVHLVASKPQPIDEAAAMPRIERFIINQRNTTAIAKEMTALRDIAKIERLGEFAVEPATPTPSATAPEQIQATTTSAAPPAKLGSPSARAVTPGVDDQAVARGVAGLK